MRQKTKKNQKLRWIEKLKGNEAQEGCKRDATTKRKMGRSKSKEREGEGNKAKSVETDTHIIKRKKKKKNQTLLNVKGLHTQLPGPKLQPPRPPCGSCVPACCWENAAH